MADQEHEKQPAPPADADDKSSLHNGLCYNEQRDVEFFVCVPTAWLTVDVGEFTLFFPNDAHAPLVDTEAMIRKTVNKIRV